MTRKRNTENEPYTSNYPQLAEWLQRHNARCAWQVPLGGPEHSPPAYVEGWAVNGVIIVIEVRAHKRGWDIFTPCLDPKIEATLRDAELRVGIKPVSA